MAYKEYSDSYLLTFTKKQLIRQLRVAEHNFRATEQTLNQHIENVMDWEPVKRGKWCMYFGARYPLVVCSLCGSSNNQNGSKYCPNCGARMDKEK